MRRMRSWLSAWIAVGVLITILLQPIAPVAAAVQELKASSTVSDMAPPAPLLELEAASQPNQTIATVNESPVVKGQLYFAPVVDNDGDPTTNPLSAYRVPVVGVFEEPRGMVTLAAQLVAEDVTQLLADIPVTFSLWNTAGERFTKTVRSDVWGAATASFFVRDLTSHYTYQSQSPGYGETDIREFAFDTARINHALHREAVQLAYQQDASGALAFIVHTPFALDPERDAVTLLAVRELTTELTATVAAQMPSLQFPMLEMEVTGAHTALLQVQLPPGTYRFQAVVNQNANLTAHFTTNMVSLPLANGTVLAEEVTALTLPIWRSDQPVTDDYRLVQYDAPRGKAIFALVPSLEAARLQLALPSAVRFTPTRRVGPFSWRQEIYEIELNTFVDDGKKKITLAGFDYDPIARHYTIAVELLGSEPITDMLRVDVLGPGNVVLKHEDLPVALYPDRLFYYTIEVPAELGQPQGLNITLDDPLDVIFKATLGQVRAPELAWRVRYLVSFTILTDTFYELSYTQPPGIWHGEFTEFDLEQVLEDLLKDASELKFQFGAAGWGTDIRISASKSFDDPCMTEAQRQVLREQLAQYADNMNEFFDKFSVDLIEKLMGEIARKTLDTPIPTPWPPIVWWLDVTVGFAGGAEAENLNLIYYTQFESGVEGAIGFNLDIDFNAFALLWDLYHALKAYRGLVGTLRAMEPQKPCGPPPPPNPPNPMPPDDRQDVWQSVAGFYTTSSLDTTRSNLHQWLTQAEAQNLDRAATYLTLHLRQTEMEQFSQDYGRLITYLGELDAIATATQTEWQGIISGTIPLTPSTTITEALMVQLQDFNTATAALDYPQHQQRLSTALDVAERDYQLLAGEELELQRELRILFSQNAVGVLASGFPQAPLTALRDNGIPAQLVSPWPTGSDFQGFPAPYYAPELAPRVLVIPSGGAHILAYSSEMRAWLEAYVEGGGTLLVFVQEFAVDWTLLPGGALRGPGYEDATQWTHSSTVVLTESERLVWTKSAYPQLQIDGTFTAWPQDAELLLAIGSGNSQVSAGRPVLLEYPYGAGRVIATTSYADWAWINSLGWNDDWNMLRSLLLQIYMNSLGQNIADLPHCELGDPLHFAIAITNTTPFTLTEVVAQIDPHILTSAITLPLSLAPGAAITLPVTFETDVLAQQAAGQRQVAGLYHVRLTLKPEGGRRYVQYGPIVHISNLNQFAPLALRLDSNATQAQLFQTAVVTATIINRLPFTRVVQLTGYNDLPATTHTLHVPPYGRAVHTCTLFMDSSKLASLKATIPGYDDLHANLALRLTQPNLELFAQLPPALSDGAPLTVTVYNAAFVSWELGGTVRLTLTAPSGIVLWGETLPVPPLAAGAEFSTTIPLGLPEITEWGLYRLETYIDNHAGLTRLTSLLLPRTLTYALTTRPQPVRVGTPVTLTLTGRNTGWFDLHPGIEMYVPSMGLSSFLSQPLPVGAAFTLPLTFTLPGDFDAGSYLVEVFADDGDVWYQQLLFTVPPARLAPALAAGPYLTGQPLLFTLHNTGGVTGTAATTFKLWDERGRLALGSSLLITVAAGSSVSVPITLPLGLRSGDYRFTAYGEELTTHKSFNLQRPVLLSGSQGALALRTSQDIYAEYDMVAAQGTITATEGSLQGWVALEITEALPMHKHLNQQLAYPPNTTDQRAPVAATTLDGQVFMAWVHQGSGTSSVRVAQQTAAKEWGPVTVIAEGEQPAIAVDASGGVYLVWSEVAWDGYRRIYFAQRDPGSPLEHGWSYPMPIVSTAVDPQEMPAIAVDLLGNVYVTWQEDRGGATGYDIYFAYRQAGDVVWSVPELVNYTDTAGAQTAPTLAVSRDGIVYTAWQTDDNNVYFAYRQPGGGWSTAEQIYAEFNYQSQSAPALAVDADGVVHLVWLDFDTANDKPVVYYARRLPAGAWTTAQPVDIGADQGEQSHPIIAVDAHRTAYVAWRDIGVASDSPDVAFAYRHAILGVWQASFGISENAAYADQTRPALSVNPQGGVFLAWQQSNFDESDYLSDLVCTEWAFDRGWSANGRLLQFEGSSVAGGAPDIVVGPDGTAYAVWLETRFGEWGVYFAYRPSQGQWSMPEKVNADSEAASGVFDTPSLAVDTHGQVYVAWINHQVDLYFRSRSPQGVWDIEHKVNDNAGSVAQRSPVIAVDGASNVHILWTDARNGFGRFDVYAVFRSAAGVWDINRQVNDVPGTNYAPQLALDGAGNAYALWQDDRNANDGGDIYFAYRPVGGGWGVNELVNDDGQEFIYQESPTLAVDLFGNAYAAWIDQRDQLEFDYLYLAHRSPEGTWGANMRIADPEQVGIPSSPALAVDNAGNLALAWIEKRDGGDDALNGVYLAYRSANRNWQWLGELNEGTASHLDLANAFDAAGNLHVVFEANFSIISTVYATRITFQPIEQVLRTSLVPVSTATTQPISQTIARLDPGRYTLVGKLFSEVMQPLAEARYPFAVSLPDYSVTLDITRADLTAGAPITVSGWITNLLDVPVTIPLTVSAGYRTVLTHTFVLNEYAGAPYVTTFTTTETALVSVETPWGKFVERVMVMGGPEITATLHAPASANDAPFIATLAVTNTGDSSAALQIFWKNAQPITHSVAGGETIWLTHTFQITHSAMLTAALRGDVTQDLTHWITFGTAAALHLQEVTPSMPDVLAVTYTITNTGTLEEPFLLEYRLNAAPFTRYILPLFVGQSLSNTLLFDIAPGVHTVDVRVLTANEFEVAAATLTVARVARESLMRPQLTLLSAVLRPTGGLLKLNRKPLNNTPHLIGLRSGQMAEMVVTLENAGLSLPAILEVSLFGIEQQHIITPAAGMVSTHTVLLSIPDDLPAGEYFGEVLVGAQRLAVVATLAGRSAALQLDLDRTAYSPGEPLALTVTLTETAGISSTYVLHAFYLGETQAVTLSVPGGQTIQHIFNYTVTESSRINVFLGNPIDPFAGQRLLMLDSLPVNVHNPVDGLAVTFNQLTYYPGDTVSITLVITDAFYNVGLFGPEEWFFVSSAPLWWMAPHTMTPTIQVRPGTYVLTTTVPEVLGQGQYPFMLHADALKQVYPIDVAGWRIVTRRIFLDKPRYATQDTLTATIEFWNQDAATRHDLQVEAWVYPPDDAPPVALTLPPSTTLDLTPGLNRIIITGTFTTPTAGSHRFLVNLTPPGQYQRIAAAAAQFDVGHAHIVALTADHGVYAVGQVGTAVLDVYGFGPVRIVISATTDSLLLDEDAALFGFSRYTVTVPTNVVGDQLLVATVYDQVSAVNSRFQPYNVLDDKDTLPPTLTLFSPIDHTVVESAQTTIQIVVSGTVSDNSGVVTTLINGYLVTPTVSGDFTTTVMLKQGYNIIYAVAYDAAGNTTFAPFRTVYLMPKRGVTLHAERSAALLGESITFKGVLTATGVLSDVLATARLPYPLFEFPSATTTAGEVKVSEIFQPFWYSTQWQNTAVSLTQPVTVTLEAIARDAGVFTQTVKVYWGAGLRSESNSIPITTLSHDYDVSDLFPSYDLAWHSESAQRLGVGWDTDTTSDLGHDDATDDGVEFVSGMQFTPGSQEILRVTAALPSGFLAGWVDWNHNGRFDHPDELVIAQPVTATVFNVTVTVPTTYTPTWPLALRVRLYAALPETLSPIGYGNGGEVEDYWLLEGNDVFHTLTVNKIGPGVISSEPPGITCGMTCSAQFAHGTIVTLTAVAETGYTFTGWSEDCNERGACVVTMLSDHAVTAIFSRYQLYLPVVQRQQ